MCRAGELGPEQSELRELFADGLAAYHQQNWDEAQDHFEKCLRIEARQPERDRKRRAAMRRCGRTLWPSHYNTEEAPALTRGHREGNGGETLKRV